MLYLKSFCVLRCLYHKISFYFIPCMLNRNFHCNMFYDLSLFYFIVRHFFEDEKPIDANGIKHTFVVVLNKLNFFFLSGWGEINCANPAMLSNLKKNQLITKRMVLSVRFAWNIIYFYC